MNIGSSGADIEILCQNKLDMDSFTTTLEQLKSFTNTTKHATVEDKSFVIVKRNRTYVNLC